MTKTQDELMAQHVGWLRVRAECLRDRDEPGDANNAEYCDDVANALAALRSPDPEVERLRGALAEHDATVAECRIDGARPQRNAALACDLCGARSSEPCGRKAGAAYQFIKTARAALSSNSGGR